MKRSLLFLVICFISVSISAQSKTFKVRNKTTTTTKTSFTPITVNNQSSLKSAIITNNNLYHNLGLAALNIQSVKDGDKKIIFGSDSVAPIFFERKNTALKSAQKLTAEQQCFNFLEDIKQDLHIANPSESFTITGINEDELGQQHIRLSQKYNGIKVYSSDFYVHFSGDKEVLNGKYSVIGSTQNTVPKITKEQALKVVTNNLKTITSITTFTDQEKVLLNYKEPIVETVILDDKQSFTKYSLAYHVIIRPNLMDEWYYFVNADDGSIIKKFNNTKYDGPATASAKDLNGVVRTINTYLEKGIYTMIDASQPMFDAAKNEGMIVTVDAQNTTGTKYVEITSANNTWNNPTAVSAHYNASQAYLYFKNTFNRNSINGSGGNIISFINVSDQDGSSWENATWNGRFISYGNGGSSFKPLAGAVDVAAHEMAHGVTSSTANLEYQGESGAINESISDIFGSMVDRGNWYIGEDVTKTAFIPTGRLRDMSDPHNGSTNEQPGWQPIHTSEMYTGTGDNGGVHTNSGISNYAYYLLATAITKEKAEQIYYRALTKYLTKSSQFIDLRIAVTQSAKDLYGDNSNEVTQAQKAFDSVGIYEEKPNNYNQTYPVNPGQDYLLMYDTDDSNRNKLYKSSVSGTNFSALSTTKMKGKVSIVDDGSVAVFVSTDHQIHAISLDPNNPAEVKLFPDAIWDNVAVSKDGNRLAAITSDIDTAIYVYDFGSKNWAKYTLYNPTTESGLKSGGVLFADAIEFDHTGEFLIYDSYNSVQSTSNDSISYWDIGIMRVWDNHKNNFGDGAIAKLYSNLPDSVSIGNPVFSKNSPNIIAFDYLEGNNFFAVLGLNIENMDLGIIANNSTIGYPSFSKLDDKIAYSALDNYDSPVIATTTLNADKISSSTDPVLLIDQAQWPVYYATGTRILGFSPAANFTASFKTGKAPLSTTFFDQSTNEPTSWSWTFESGNPHTSNVQNPVVTYNVPGTYAVTLKVTNSFGSNTVTKSGYIVISNNTGIDEMVSNEKVKVYPNPTKGIIEISKAGAFESDYKIEVFNFQGSLIQTAGKQKDELHSQIDLSGYPAGVYMIAVSTKNGSNQFRIIKN
jgi:Zn-dependent metalloprotease/PKD repeat protein